jgi:threonine synthase
LLYYLTDENSTLVREWMTTVDGASSKFTLDQEWLVKLQTEFRSARVDDLEMCQTMRSVLLGEGWNYVADPHTAVALSAAEQLGYCSFCIGGSEKKGEDYVDITRTPACDDVKGCAAVVVLSTASPCKFQESVTAALGEQGWKDYVNSAAFPPKAKNVWTKPDQPPIVFEGNNLTLEQKEQIWQIKLQRLLVVALE